MSNVQLSEDKNKMVWKLKKDGMFAVKSYAHLVKRGRDCQFSGPTDMESKAPPRIIFLPQETGQKCILTIDKLMKKGKIMVNGCYLCMKTV